MLDSKRTSFVCADCSNVLLDSIKTTKGHAACFHDHPGKNIKHVLSDGLYRDHIENLDMSLQRVIARTGATFRVLFLPYSKSSNAYAYIPFTSFHGLRTFRGWVLAELLRLLTHRGGGYFLPPSMLQRIPTEFPQDSFSRGHTSIEVSVICSEPPKKVQLVFRDLPSL